MVLCAEGAPRQPLPPGEVSVTTKSIMFSVERPICEEGKAKAQEWCV